MPTVLRENVNFKGMQPIILKVWKSKVIVKLNDHNLAFTVYNKRTVKEVGPGS